MRRTVTDAPKVIKNGRGVGINQFLIAKLTSRSKHRERPSWRFEILSHCRRPYCVLKIAAQFQNSRLRRYLHKLLKAILLFGCRKRIGEGLAEGKEAASFSACLRRKDTSQSLCFTRSYGSSSIIFSRKRYTAMTNAAGHASDATDWMITAMRP